MHSPEYEVFQSLHGGPAGSALASKLARTASKPRILLLEAGPKKDSKSLRVSGKRWVTFQEPDMNWMSKTTPQAGCNGREINYSRGKALGGGSAINFGCYTVGARDDYDEWAEIVGDDFFSWERMQERFKELESFDGEIAERYKAFANPRPEDHGREGALKLGFAKEWEEDTASIFEAFRQAGLPFNPDHNSGDPIGVSLSINSAYRGVRTTAADLLVDHPENLEILTEKDVTRVIIRNNKAVGVEVDGEIYHAKEIILSAGSLGTPRILMHSGIGPADQLSAFNIPLHANIPAIGQNLRDHPFVPLCLMRNPKTNTRNAFYSSPTAQETAMEEWLIDGSGPWSQHGSQLIMGWMKSEAVQNSQEYRELPQATKDFLSRPTIPHYELISGLPIHMLNPDLTSDYSYICLVAFLLNQQSRGEVRLQSSDPTVPLLFNPNFLTHEYDQRVCIESYRELWNLASHPSFAKDTVSTLLAPASTSDEDILAFWKNVAASAWHMTGTAKMGRPGEDAAVDSRFRVFGIQGLRVADLSVVPVLTNNHTQATAYVVGVSCADVLIAEYGLAVPMSTSTL
ncbi:oxidoreductase [Aspergillus californicus]